ncbi:hypothetical protein ACPGAX_001332 [Enterobacter quasiroggenkampii]
MSDELIKLDVEKINGYLCAVECLNRVNAPRVEYSFTHINNSGSLLKSVQDHIAAAYPNTVIDYWHIEIEGINENQFNDSIKSWFFLFGKAEVLCDQLKPLQDEFLDLLNQLVYTPSYLPYSYGSTCLVCYLLGINSTGLAEWLIYT